MSGKYRKDHNCLNCGFHVEEHYCSRCGQPNLVLDENFWQFISHSVAHYFHFDNKFFQTLVPLITKPGKVTLDYLAGKRARYINPISMYIFVSIVYFLVVYAPRKKDKPEVKIKTETVAKNKLHFDSLAAPLTGLVNKEVISKTQQVIEESLDKETFRALSFKKQDTVLKNLKAQLNTKKSDSLSRLIGKLDAIHIIRNDSTYASYLARQKTLPASERDNMMERFMAKRRIGFGEKSEIIQEQLEHNRPKQYFLFMPLMALFIMMNFRKNHIKYLDHLIFTIHGMTAFFIVSTVVQPLKILFSSYGTITGLIGTALIIWVCWYLFKSLKIFYQRKTSTTIWRMIWIAFLYSITLKISEMIMLNIIFYVTT